MYDSIEEEINPKPQEIKKLNIIHKLKEYQEHAKVTQLLKDFTKKQEIDYFLTQNNIKFGKMNPKSKKNEQNIIQYPIGFYSSNSKKPTSLHTNSLLKYKSNVSTSSGRIKNKDLNSINKNIIIDNKYLKNFFNDIRKRISEEKQKKEDKYKLLLEVPYGVRKSLINQENIFMKSLKNQQLEKNLQEKIKNKCKKNNINELLINKSKNFDKKYQNYTIIEKNISEENRYRDNLWNITLRNLPIQGKYETIGYLNVGNNFQPKYTFFNLNKTIEYFNNPRHQRNKSEEKKNSKLFSSLNEDNYNVKIKSNLNFLNNLKTLELTGRNLLDVEDKRESEIKGKKIIYKKHDLDKVLYRKRSIANDINNTDGNQRYGKTSTDKIYEEQCFAKNYKIIDFYKNANLTSKYSNDFY